MESYTWWPKLPTATFDTTSEVDCLALESLGFWPECETKTITVCGERAVSARKLANVAKKRKRTMQETLNRRICDHCKKVATQNPNDRVIGGNEFAGWLHVAETSGSILLEDKSGPWDFCGRECMASFFVNSLPTKGSE